MQLKIISHLILITCWIVSLRAKTLYPKGCYECEEEIWEEVPCEEIPSNSTTVSVPHSTTPSYKTTTSTQKPLTTKTTTPHTPTTIKHTTTTRPVVTTTEEPYKKCYCECKVDCKEFCRKVIISPSEKDIVQVSKISETTKNGRLESTHILQRELLPKSSYNTENPSEPLYNQPTRYEASTPTPSKSVLVPKYYGNKFIDSEHYKNNNKPALPTVHYYSKPSSVSLGEPIYHSAKSSDQSYANVEDYELPYYPHQPPPPPVPPSSQSYYSNYNPNSYDFSLPFENAYSGIGMKARNSIDYLNAPKYKPKDPNLQYQSTLGNGLNYDDSFDSLIKEFLNNMPSNEVPYESLS